MYSIFLTHNFFLGVRPSPKSGCFWKVVNCRTKVKNGQWNEIDCEFDKETIRCCNYECGNNYYIVAAGRAKMQKQCNLGNLQYCRNGLKAS